jgi:hypothetical protein
VSSSLRLKRNDVFRRNSDTSSFAVVIEQHRSNGEVRWTRHPVPHGATAGRSGSVDRFLHEHTRVDQETVLAQAVISAASDLVAKLPAPARWAGSVSHDMRRKQLL